MGTKEPNRALYFTVALIVAFVGVLASVVWVTSRGPDEADGTTIAGILAFATPTIAGILALLAAGNADTKATAAAKNANEAAEVSLDTNRKVNGTLDGLVRRNLELAEENKALRIATGDPIIVATAKPPEPGQRP